MDGTIKSLGVALRKHVPLPAAGSELPKAMRRLIAELESREAQRDRKRERPQKSKSS
jgi:hypothetical protein